MSNHLNVNTKNSGLNVVTSKESYRQTTTKQQQFNKETAAPAPYDKWK